MLMNLNLVPRYRLYLGGRGEKVRFYLRWNLGFLGGQRALAGSRYLEVSSTSCHSSAETETLR